jgi:hypothetical protein
MEYDELVNLKTGITEYMKSKQVQQMGGAVKYTDA